MSFIQTYSGKKFSLIDPQPEDVCIEDIEHALGLICRFNGHTKHFYSVAQHSILVSKIVFPEDAYEGLMHDAGEAYYGDISTPMKIAMGRYYGSSWGIIMDRIDSVIAQRFRLSDPMPDSVHHADKVALATEKRDLLGPCNFDWVIELPEPYPKGILPYPPMVAIKEFHQCWERLHV